MQIIPSPEYLKVIPIRHHCLSNLIYFLRLLGLPTSRSEDHIALNVEVGSATHVAFHTYQAEFFCVLEVVAMTLGDLAVYCLFDPCNLINQFVAIGSHHLECKPVLSIDDPHKQESIRLQLVKRDGQYLLI